MQQYDTLYSHYIRIEAVNHAHFIYDTNDLSTIRGGGLLMLKAVKDVESVFENELEVISSGASMGLFGVQIGINVDDTIERIKTLLNTTHPMERVDLAMNQRREAYKRATILIAIQPHNNDFGLVKEKLFAQILYQQMITPSLKVPDKTGKAKICSINRLSPVLENEDVIINEDKLSKNHKNNSIVVNIRSVFGREQKQTMYQSMDIDIEFDSFADNFQEIGKVNPIGPIDGKLCVVYIDGNQFSRFGGETPNELIEWDEYIQKERNKLLKNLINSNEVLLEEWLKKWLEKTDKKIKKFPFETLLWGGDEMMFVMPACLGISFVQNFLQKTADWKFNDKSLTHAIGTVFCHDNAPITQIKQLAHDIAEIGKKEKDYQAKNSWNYLILESFDHTGGNYDDYLEHHYEGLLKSLSPEKSIAQQLNWSGDFEQFSKQIGTLCDIKQFMPRGRLYQHVKAFRNEAFDEKKQQDKLFYALSEDEKKKCFDVNDKLNWIHLIQLWDYLPAKSSDSESMTESTTA